MTAWTDHLKAFASSHGITYGAAMKSPECKSAYKKTDAPQVAPKMGNNIQMVISETKTRGRPKKYATEAEAKKAKSASSVASNKRRKGKLSGRGGEQSKTATHLAIDTLMNIQAVMPSFSKPAVDTRSIMERLQFLNQSIEYIEINIKNLEKPEEQGVYRTKEEADKAAEKKRRRIIEVKHWRDKTVNLRNTVMKTRELEEREGMGKHDDRTIQKNREKEAREVADLDDLIANLKKELINDARDEEDDEDYGDAKRGGVSLGALDYNPEEDNEGKGLRRKHMLGKGLRLTPKGGLIYPLTEQHVAVMLARGLY
jgi:hypothetical protein